MNCTAKTYSNISPAVFYGGGFCGGIDPRREEYAGEDVAGVAVPDYASKYDALQDVIKDNYATFEVDYYGVDNDNYVAGEGFCCGDNNLKTKSIADDSPNYEKLQYYYHPDHLGSASYITNLDGEVVQHIEYMPFGEVFLEERNNTWNTPFLFSGKELDEETGLYYYGARYYNPRISIFYGCDPLMEDYPSWTPYHYCHNNPVNLVDPTGMEANPIYDENGEFLGTDDKGLQGEAIIMNKTDFKQGMSHDEAMEKGNTLDDMEFEDALDFANNGNVENFLNHFNNLNTIP